MRASPPELVPDLGRETERVRVLWRPAVESSQRAPGEGRTLRGAFTLQKTNNMTVTKEQQDQLAAAAAPLLEWLNANCHPHCTAIVTPTTVEVLEGFVVHRTAEFVRD